MKSYAMEIPDLSAGAECRQERGDCFHLENPENGEMKKGIFGWQGEER